MHKGWNSLDDVEAGNTFCNGKRAKEVVEPVPNVAESQIGCKYGNNLGSVVDNGGDDP